MADLGRHELEGRAAVERLSHLEHGVSHGLEKGRSVHVTDVLLIIMNESHRSFGLVAFID